MVIKNIITSTGNTIANIMEGYIGQITGNTIDAVIIGQVVINDERLLMKGKVCKGLWSAPMHFTCKHHLAKV